MAGSDAAAGAPRGVSDRGWEPGSEPDAALVHGFDTLTATVRELQDVLAGARPDAPTMHRVEDLLGQATTLLAADQVGERRQLFGKLRSVPGRAQTMAPVLRYDDTEDGDRVTGTVTFGRFYLGGNGAVHGGALPLVFDEILGRLAQASGRPQSRTAYLHTDYRAITPVGRPVRFEGWIESMAGRKLYARARLTEGETLLCEAEGLFLVLLPGQP